MSGSHHRFILIAIGVLLSIVGCSATQEHAAGPPETQKRPVFDTLHGTVIEDPYRWLEDQQAPETRAWLKAQDDYTQSIVSRFPGMEKIRNRFSELLRIEEVEMPFKREGKYFLRKRPVGCERFLICVRDGIHGDDKVLIDPERLCDDQSLSAEIWDVSADGKVLAYGVRRGGLDETSMHFFDVVKGVDLADSLPQGLYFGLSVNADNSGFYYVRIDDVGGRVFYHRFGTSLESDSLIFGGQYSASEWIAAALSEDRHHLIIRVSYGSSFDRCEFYVQDVYNNGPIKTVVKDVRAGFFCRLAGDRIYIMTNYEAPNWCIYETDVSDPAMDNWNLIIPEREDGVIDEFSLVGGKIFVTYQENACSRVRIFEPDGKYSSDVEFPAPGTVHEMSQGWAATEVFYSYSSFHVPPTIYRHEFSTGTTEVWYRASATVGSDDIEVKQVWYTSADGTRVPMWVAHRKDIDLDGNNPTYLTGYGGFNLGITPKFKSTYAVWLESGGVFAYPCLRGGNEFGEQWHRGGMFENKQNVFDDFIAAAEWLIENKYTSPEKLAIRGGSNGGLLVGAVMNQRPDLFKAVICTYPLLDMLRYHKFLMGPYWVTEYGSPDNPEHFEFIYKYSPYHNVREGVKYPAVMYVTGDGDTRVDPLHARKMTALMQATAGSDSPVLLLYDTEAGHAGDLAVYKEVEEASAQMGFLAWQLGMKP